MIGATCLHYFAPLVSLLGHFSLLTVAPSEPSEELDELEDDTAPSELDELEQAKIRSKEAHDVWLQALAAEANGLKAKNAAHDVWLEAQAATANALKAKLAAEKEYSDIVARVDSENLPVTVAQGVPKGNGDTTRRGGREGKRGKSTDGGKK